MFQKIELPNFTKKMGLFSFRDENIVFLQHFFRIVRTLFYQQNSLLALAFVILMFICFQLFSGQ